MLLNGVNHVALLTHDSDRLVATPTVSRARCASRTPTPSPACTTRRAPPPPGTPPRDSRRTVRARSPADWRGHNSARSGRSGCGHTCGSPPKKRAPALADAYGLRRMRPRMRLWLKWEE